MYAKEMLGGATFAPKSPNKNLRSVAIMDFFF